MNEEKARKAREYFLQGYNCSQSVLAAWCEELGLDMNTALRISACFGGGMGRLREVCGACSGAFMVIGLKHGYTEGKDFKTKSENYAMVQKFAARFKEENGFDSIICREMLGLNGASDPTPEKRTEQYYKKRPCPDMIALASGLLDEFV